MKDRTLQAAADCRVSTEQKKAVEKLHNKLMEGCTKASETSAIDAALWQTVIAYQSYPFHTSSGLPFSYTIKQGKAGAYTGELIVSRKEGSKTLTRSSVLFAFHTVLDAMTMADALDAGGKFATAFVPPEYKGPKAIGQIFGISYVYSLFWTWGIIKVPEKVADRLGGKRESRMPGQG